MSELETPADDVQPLPALVAEEPADVVPEAPEVPEPPATGDGAVDQALDGLAAVLREGGPLEGQVAAFEAAHRALQDRLADVEG